MLQNDDFDQIVRPLIDPGYKLALAMLGDRGLAEDAVQEAALTAWRKLPALRDRSALRPWFLAIVAHQCRSLRRRRWWRVLKLPNVDADGQSAITEELAVLSLDIERGLCQGLPPALAGGAPSSQGQLDISLLAGANHLAWLQPTGHPIAGGI